MCAAIKAVLDVWAPLCQYFDLEKMTRSESGRLDRQLLRRVLELLKDTQFVMTAHIYMAIGSIIEKYASRLEGCHCHSHIWMLPKVKWSTKLKRLFEETGYRHCIWKGRQAAWWVAEGIRALLQEIATAMTDTLQNLLNAATPNIRASALQTLEKIKTKLRECVHDKMAFWFHIPWKLLGVFWCCLGGSIQASKQILRECIAEYDHAMERGQEDSIHRVAHRLLFAGKLCGKQLREWLADNFNQPLERFTHAYICLLEYALISLVERRVESIHPIISRLTRKTTYILPASVCAQVRLTNSLDMLRTCDAFHRFCLDTWRKRTVYNSILVNRYTTEQLAGMTRPRKLKAIYQCGIDEEFELAPAAHEQHGLFTEAVESNRPQVVKQPETTYLFVAFLKEVLGRSDFYSLPRRIFDTWMAMLGQEEKKVEGLSVGPVLALADEATTTRWIDFGLSTDAIFAYLF